MHDTIANFIYELEVPAVTCNGKFSIVILAAHLIASMPSSSWESCKQNRISGSWVAGKVVQAVLFGKGLAQTVGGEGSWVANLVELELLEARSVIAPVLTESLSTGSVLICGVWDCSFVKDFRASSGLFSERLLAQDEILLLCPLS